MCESWRRDMDLEDAEAAAPGMPSMLSLERSPWVEAHAEAWWAGRSRRGGRRGNVKRKNLSCNLTCYWLSQLQPQLQVHPQIEK